MPRKSKQCKPTVASLKRELAEAEDRVRYAWDLVSQHGAITRAMERSLKYVIDNFTHHHPPYDGVNLFDEWWQEHDVQMRVLYRALLANNVDSLHDVRLDAAAAELDRFAIAFNDLPESEVTPTHATISTQLRERAAQLRSQLIFPSFQKEQLKRPDPVTTSVQV